MKLVKYFIESMMCMFLLMACSTQQNEHTRKLNFDENWCFHYGDIPVSIVFHSDTVQWRDVDIPHDWSIEMPFVKSAGGIAVGQTQGGVGWYRKIFKISGAESSERKLLYFEGVYMESEIWVNGKKVFYHPYGYTSFYCDITDFCNSSGLENIIAVKVRNEGLNTRWYTGSGIYRHVWLIKTGQLYLDEWGVFVTTELLSETRSKVKIAVDVSNQSNESTDAVLNVVIKNDKGEVVGEQTSRCTLKRNSTETVHHSIFVDESQLWSVDTPVLYTADIKLFSDGIQKDVLAIPFGIRSISFSTKEGFLLNGIPVKLKGGCVHHDNGLLGAVALDRAEERKVELLKANGFNAVRCAHNPPSEKFLEACDRLGLLVIDEAFDQWQKPKNQDDYHRFFDEWSEVDLTSMVLRDRNHPSVIMWSIGNEIQERSDSSGVEIAQKLKRIVRKYDTTRPVTAAVNDYWDNPALNWEASIKAFASLDVCGYNYMWWEYENDSKRYPERIIYGSETTAMERAVNWDLVEKYPGIIGDFIWTAIDYLGESGIGHAMNVDKGSKNSQQFLDWPWFNAWCGDIDICGYSKPQAALRDVLWRNRKIAMLVHSPILIGQEERISYWGWPDEEFSWNWKGYEGQEMNVKVYSRYSSVRLYLDGMLLEEKNTIREGLGKYSAQFKVKYAPGSLKAVGVDAGIEKDECVLVTSGPPVGIHLKADRLFLKDTKNDLSYIQIELVDKDGNMVSDLDCRVNLSISGKGRILSAGNACPTDMESFRSSSPMTYKGRALAILQPEGGKGCMELTVKTEEYGEKAITINVE